ncbi:type I methionyl aminopeptidase [bacterium]|nr:type I methionyl aminopeptidase [bacterium]|tara:strand:+ start:7635 stop:8399 length:765 start_codon:yes stop_codon:yes gene_type:complete
MAIIHTEIEKNKVRESGRRLAVVLDKVIEKVVPGVSLRELNEYAESLIRKNGDKPAFLGYQPSAAMRPYPATLCVSINNEVVHGIPDDRKLKEGDIVGLDLGIVHDGFITDMARTVPVGEVDETAKKLLETTQKALRVGIEAVRDGGHVGDIGHAIGALVKESGFSVVEELGGHAVGQEVHEDPFIPNFGARGTGTELKEGMILALEPIVNKGSGEVELDKDGYTFKTKDGKRSAHFEDTILITKNGAEILTKK